LDQALAAATDCGRQYEAAPPRIRRQINHGFFKKLLIGPGGTVDGAELTEPFAALLGDGRVVRVAETTETETVGASQVVPEGRTDNQAEEGDRQAVTAVSGVVGDIRQTG
jgi:hypothetical protein